jgi:phosphohistidine phosphatase
MELYLLRHGEAELRSPSKKDDERALTDKGKRDVQRVAERVKKAKIKPDVVLTSPLRRAKETAEIAAEVLGLKRILETKSLSPEASPQVLWKELATIEHADHVILAGHEPNISHLAQFLLASKVPLDFKKGAMMRISIAREATPKGVLKWMITPKLA